MTTTERAKEWINLLHVSQQQLISTGIIRDLLVENELLNGELERFKHMAEQNSTEMCEWMEKCNKLTSDAKVLAVAVGEIESLIAQSSGVSGWHLNGDVAPWGDLYGDGRYAEWLEHLSPACEVARKYLGEITQKKH